MGGRCSAAGAPPMPGNRRCKLLRRSYGNRAQVPQLTPPAASAVTMLRGAIDLPSNPPTQRFPSIAGSSMMWFFRFALRSPVLPGFAEPA